MLMALLSGLYAALTVIGEMNQSRVHSVPQAQPKASQKAPTILGAACALLPCPANAAASC